MSADRITLVIPTLTSGGAERVLTTMANYWADHRKQVTVLTLAGQDDKPFYPLDPDVRRIGLDALRPARTPLHAAINNAVRLLRLRRAIRTARPDVVISFLDQTNVLTLVATRGLRVPVIVSEHTDPGLAQRHPVWDRLRSALYPRAAAVVVLSESSRRFFSPRVRARTRIIPNPIQVDDPTGPVTLSARSHIVAMGRFGPEKGFDLLLDAFSRIAAAIPDWDLVIWGDGVLRPELTAQRDRLGLADRVSFPGRTSTPHAELRKAGIYALTSRREGFPMALAEAMGCGLPAVAFDLPSGPRDIIRDGIDGVLVPNGDTGAFASALASLIRDAPRRHAMAARAPEVLERFGVERVMTTWNELMDEAMTRQ
jgi:glycosyltransferase involved in cell wall biosynthesis